MRAVFVTLVVLLLALEPCLGRKTKQAVSHPVHAWKSTALLTTNPTAGGGGSSQCAKVGLASEGPVLAETLRKTYSEVALEEGMAPRTAVDQPLYMCTSTDDFYMTLGIGTQTFNVLVDTMSSRLLLTSCACSQCGSVPTCYKHTASANNVTCSESPFVCAECFFGWCGFTEGTLDYVWEYDTVQVGPSLSSSVLLAVAFAENGPSAGPPSALDGVLGLGVPNVIALPSALTSITAASGMSAVFSVCFSKATSLAQAPTGLFVFGGTDLGTATASLKTVPLQGGTYYSVALDGVFIGESFVSTANTALGAVVATTVAELGLPSQLYTTIEESFVSLCNSSSMSFSGECPITQLFSGECVSLTPAQVALLPSIALSISDGLGSASSNFFKLVLEPSDYLLPSVPNGPMCLQLSNTGALPYVMLGRVVMSVYYTVVDLDANQVGFAASGGACQHSTYTIFYNGGNNQEAAVGYRVDEPFSVIVINSTSHAPIANIDVSFSVVSGPAKLSQSVATTDKNGIASVTLTVGVLVGDVVIEASLENALNSPITFDLTIVQSTYKANVTWIVVGSISIVLLLVFTASIYPHGSELLRVKKWNTLKTRRDEAALNPLLAAVRR